MPRKWLVTAILTIAVLGCMVSNAAAQNPFIIDGNVPANGTFSGPLQTADPFGSVRELGPVNGANTKVGVIHSAVPPMLSFTNPNGQVDLRNIWTQTAKAADGDIWFYFAWERDANTGSGFIAYEFQQAALSPTCAYTAADIDMILPESEAETSLINSCNPWQNRQPGDFLIMWDQGGNALTITRRVFSLSGGQLVLGPSQPLGTAVAAISPDGFRGEASINLTIDVFPPDGSCVNFANIIPGTVTGNSDTADYKDTVLSRFPPISSCGIVTVTKVTQPAGLSGSFPYTLARQDGSQIRFDGTTQIDQTLTHDGDSTGSPITGLIAATNYTLTEGALASPWELVSISCTTDDQPPVDLTNGGTFAVDANALTACTITNKLRRGSIRVIKNVVNDNGGTAVAGDFTITLGDSANTTFAGVSGPGITFTFDAGYTFDVAEIGLPAGYVQTGEAGDCAGEIVADVTKVCVITNDDVAPSLTLVKVVINDNGGTAATTDFILSADGPTPISGAGGATSGANFSAGTYALSETLVAGYIAGAWSCTGSGTQNGESITLALAQSATCTIVNNDQKAAPAAATAMNWVLHDSATVTGIRPGAPDAGSATITFRLFGPNDTACTTPINGGGEVRPAAGGSASTVAGFQIGEGQVGTYRWIAAYSGDQFNLPASTACGAETHTITIP
jgi:hypothetical protein